MWSLYGHNLIISSIYPTNIDRSEIFTECFQMARDRNTSVAIRELRRKLERDR
jgi:hypothetical protein